MVGAGLVVATDGIWFSLSTIKAYKSHISWGKKCRNVGLGIRFFCKEKIFQQTSWNVGLRKKDAFNEGPVSLSRRKVAPKSEESVSLQMTHRWLENAAFLRTAVDVCI